MFVKALVQIGMISREIFFWRIIVIKIWEKFEEIVNSNNKNIFLYDQSLLLLHFMF